MTKGITGTGQGFDVPGRRLGGFTRQPPLSSLGAIAATAADKRVRAGNLLPSGPHRLGGDHSLMSDLSPAQAAAMAAERRLLDDIWCGSQNDSKEAPACVRSVKRSSSWWSDAHPSSSHHHWGSSEVIDLTEEASSCENKTSCGAGDEGASSSSGGTKSFRCNANPSRQESAVWECGECTLLNPVSLPKYCFLFIYFPLIHSRVLFPWGPVVSSNMRAMHGSKTKGNGAQVQSLVLQVLHP